MENNKRELEIEFENNFENDVYPNKKIKKEVNNELNNYKLSSYKPNELSILNNLIQKNMELTASIAEYKINNKFINDKLQEVQMDAHLKITSSASLISINDDFKKSNKLLEQKIKNLEITLKDKERNIFWSKFVIVFQVMLLSLMLMHIDLKTLSYLK